MAEMTVGLWSARAAYTWSERQKILTKLTIKTIYISKSEG